MENKNNGGPAFPRTQWTGSDKNAAHRDVSGMTLRDWFAGQASDGDIDEVLLYLRVLGTPISRASARYYVADAMLAERDK